MKRILIGLIVAAVLAAGGWFGFNLYAKHRATAEVETAFEQIRASGGKASHGKVEFDLMSRTLTIEDIAVTPGSQSQAQVKITGIKGIGVRQIDDTRFSADSIDITGLDVALDQVGPAKVKASYKIPQLTMRDYAGPVHIGTAPANGSLIDLYRYVLGQYASVAASSLTAPTLTMSFDSGSGPGGSGEITYSGLAVQNLKQGKVDAIKADRAAISVEVKQPGRPDKLTGELANVIVNDFDATAIIAALDPQTSSDETYRRVYRQVSAGPYAFKSAQGLRVDVDGFVMEKYRRAAVEIPAGRALCRATARSIRYSDTCTVARDAGEGRRSLRGSSHRQGRDRQDFDRHAAGDREGQRDQVPRRRVRHRGRRYAGAARAVQDGALRAEILQRGKSDALGNRPRQSRPGALARSDAGPVPGARRCRIKGVVSPYKNTRQLITIDTISLNWGQLVGSIPSKANLVVKMVTPTDPSNPAQRPLIMAGVDKLAIDLDLGAAWTELSGAFALAPATIDLGNLAKAQVRFALANAPRGLFTTTDPMEAMSEMAQVETGALELSLRDSGVVDLVVAQFSRMQKSAAMPRAAPSPR
ncbi:hypothetical protein ACQ5SK_41095 [Bradyrhizobium japonicum]